MAYNVKNEPQKPIVLRGILSSKLVTVKVGDLTTLKIDSTYQREKVDRMSDQIATVLRSGGVVPAPIHVVKRKDGGLYIVDGQQRFWGHLDAEKDLLALIHEVKDYNAEKDLFIALNATTAVTPGLIVRAWPGPVSALIEDANNEKNHPLYQRVNYGIRGLGSHGKSRISAIALLRGLRAVAGGNTTGGPLQPILREIDQKMAGGAARERCEKYLLLAANVFSTTQPSPIFTCGLGMVAYKRWVSGGGGPTDGQEARLRDAPWSTMIDARTWKYLPIVLAEIEKRWPAEK